MKRQIPSTSKDSFKDPNPTKKQPTLDCFLKLQKPKPDSQAIKLQHSTQNQNVKLQAPGNQNSHSSCRSNSIHSKNSVPVFNINDPAPCLIKPSPKQRQQQLTLQYLNVEFTYACQQCHIDITNYTKIILNERAYCIQCAGNKIEQPYTVVKALHDESLKQFPEQKLQYEEPVWSFKTELRLIEGLQLYGIESFELIEKHAKTQHHTEEIREHLKYFVNKVSPDLRELSKEALNLIQIQPDAVEAYQVEIPKKMQKKESISSKDLEKLENELGKDAILHKHNERVRNLLKIYNWNPRTDELQYDEEPTLFSLLASEIGRQDIDQHFGSSEKIEIITQRRKYEMIEKKLLNKALREIIKSESDSVINLQKIDNAIDLQSQSFESLESSQNSEEESEKEFLSEEQKWTLFKCQTIKKYNILKPEGNQKLQRYLRKAKLLHELDKIQKKGDKELTRKRNKYCKENKVEKISLEEYAQKLSERELRKIYRMDETQKIYQELEDLNEKSKLQDDSEPACEMIVTV